MKNIIKKIYKLFERIGSILLFESYFKNRQLKIIQNFALDTTSILEIGAGKNSYFHKYLRNYTITGFDIYEKSLIQAKELGKIDNYVVGDVNKLEIYFTDKSYDLVCAFDLIEHLKKEDGYSLILNMERLAKKMIVIYTPNGFQYQPASVDNPYQEHKSGWSFDEMKEMGFEIIGFNGVKVLRGMYALPKYRPYFLFNFISFITEILIQKSWLNKYQYAILCYKSLNKNLV